MAFLEYLVEKDIVSQENLKQIKEAVSKGTTLEVALKDNGLSSKEILENKSEYYNVPIKDLSNTNVPFDILKYIPEESAVHYQFVS